MAALPVNVRQLARGAGVQARLLTRPTVKRRLGVFSRSDAELSPAAAAFLNHMQTFARQRTGLPDEAITAVER